MSAMKCSFTTACWLLCSPLLVAAPLAQPAQLTDAPTHSAWEHAQSMAEALQQLLTSLRSIDSPSAAPAARPAVAAAVAAFHTHAEALQQVGELPATQAPEIEAQLKRCGEIYAQLRQLGESDDFVSLLWPDEALIYHLLIQSPYLPCILHEETANYIIGYYAMAAHRNRPEAMLPHLDKLRAFAAERHQAFLAAHPEQYSGGNGAGEQSAIVLDLPELADEERAEEVNRLMVAYMRSVYPEFTFGYHTYMACPDGAFYDIQVLIPGLYATADGTHNMIKYPVWFRTKAPGNNPDARK